MKVLDILCAVLGMLAVAQATTRYFILAPNVVRVDVEETILVNVLGTGAAEIPVTVYFQLAGSNDRISETTIAVSEDDPKEAILRVRRDQLLDIETSGHQFIKLVASANSANLQFQDSRPILLSYQAGFVFIQTDKPLYTPSQRVDIRVVALDQDMSPDDHHDVQVDILSPQKIIVERFKKRPVNGFLPLQFSFPPHPVFGNWTVNAHYGHQFKGRSSVQFEVKEYVLPKFYVEVEALSMYMLPVSENLVSRVTARYIFGEPVVGSYYVTYGVFADDGSLTNLQTREGRLNERGQENQELNMADVEVDNWQEILMGKRLIIQAFVTDQATGETINANNTMVTFSRTPYEFNWELTQRFFKKGLPFAVKATVQYMSGLPAADVPVTVSAIAVLTNGQQVNLQGAGADVALQKRSGSQGEVDFRLDVPATANEMTITLETSDPDLHQANAHSTFTVQPQQSNSGEYLVVRLPSGDVRQTQQIESQSSVEVQLTNPANVHILYYFVIAGGRIVHKGAKNLVNLNTALTFEITHEMAPSSRVVAYYEKDGEIIADSLFMEVEEKCKNPIGLSFKGLPNDEENDKYEWNGGIKNVELEVRAKGGTTVGLLAVDEAIFKLRNYHRLTQKKVFKRMAGYDLGCGPGGGQTTASILKDTGVTVLTSANLNIEHREALGCLNDARRRRRSVNETEREEILSRYEGILREYCEKGMRELAQPEEFTCAIRAKRLTRLKRLERDSPKVAAFFECCQEMESISRGRSGAGDAGNVILENIMVRSDFPESWMFDEVVVEAGVNGEKGKARHPVTLPDSVTTWVIEAVGVLGVYGMCVADPIKLEVRPPFFLDISMPYSVQRYEQIEIVASVFNYADEVLNVTVYLKGAEGLCSDAQPGEYSKGISVIVQPKKPASVKFVIVPLVIRKLPIEIVAVANSKQYRDAIRKPLTVRPEGYEKRDVVSNALDPANFQGLRSSKDGGPDQSYEHIQFWGAEGERMQVDIINYTLSRNAIPGTHKVHISLMGNVIGSVIDTVIGGLETLLRIPNGCGEQTMLGFAPNVYVYTYLKRSDQFTAGLEASAEQYIKGGVIRELTFRRDDGSFSVWVASGNYPSSTWLTAFVAKVMCRAKEFALVDDSIICSAMEWLITQTQNDPNDGSYNELYRVYHREMTGGVQGKVSLTAYVLISLLECRCKEIDKVVSVAAATALLEAELETLTRPYAIAITAYALTLANSIKGEDAIQMLKDIAIDDEASGTRRWGSDDSSFAGGQKPYWYQHRPKAIEVETTSYALLALLEADDVEYSHPIVNWLTNQENYNGGFVSTQDTVIGLQALSEYAARVQQYEIDIQCSVKCQEAEFDESFVMKPGNAIVRQHGKIIVPEAEQKITVLLNTEGTGMGQFKFESTYYVPEPDQGNCDFELLIDESEEAQEWDEANGPAGEKDKEYFVYDVRVRYLRGERTGMAILDVGLYTGFKAVEGDLKNLEENSDGRIQRYENTDRSVVFYFEDIPGAEAVRILFRAEREFNVGKTQPVAIKVYDYYNPTEECVKFINPGEGSNMLGTLCDGDTCVCAAGSCAANPLNKQPDYKVYNLKDKACTSTSHFAYEVNVDSVEDKRSFLVYTMTIDAPLKEGLDTVYKGQQRTFWMSKSCDTPKIRTNQKYLVIGSAGIKTKDDSGNDMYKYIIDDRMFIYEWPTGNKLGRNKWKKILETLKNLKIELFNGCPS